MNSKEYMDSSILESTSHDECAMTYMHISVANLQRVDAVLSLFSFFSDARSNECCDTVVILGNGSASPVCADTLLFGLLLAYFLLLVCLLPACCYLDFSLLLAWHMCFLTQRSKQLLLGDCRVNNA